MKKTYSMSKEEAAALAHYESEHRNNTMVASFWKGMAGQVMSDVLRRVGEDPDKMLADGRKLNIDFDRSVVEITDAEPKTGEKLETPIVMPNGDPAQAPKEAVTDIK